MSVAIGWTVGCVVNWWYGGCCMVQPVAGVAGGNRAGIGGCTVSE